MYVYPTNPPYHNPLSGTCPGCGRCNHCGRPQPTPWYPYHRHYYNGPQWDVRGSTTLTVDTNNKTTVSS